MRIIHSQLLTFGTIGVINTTIDMASYSLLISIGSALWLAIILSTSLGLISSFILNKRFTFKQGTAKKSQALIRFIIVTTAGLWLLQPVIVIGLSHLFSLTSVRELFTLKLIATVAGMVWNFYWYKLYVFKSKLATKQPT